VPKGKDQEQAQEGTSGKGSEFDPLSSQDECSEDSEKQSRPIGRPISPKRYQQLKEKARTSPPLKRNHTQEDSNNPTDETE